VEFWSGWTGREAKVFQGLTDRFNAEQTSVYVTVRAAQELEDFCANLAAPILICAGIGHQVINQAPDAPVRAPLFAGLERERTQAA